MTTAKIVETLQEEYPEALTADGFDDAILGVVDGWRGTFRDPVVCYDYEKCVEILRRDSGMSEEDAREYLEFNTLGAYVGEFTPLFLHRWREEQEE